jgi:co-chaperonin GroES (HSP10)
MADPTKIGNAADELGEHLEGKDFGVANRSAAPPPIDAIHVDVHASGEDVLVFPKRNGELSQSIGNLSEGAKEQLAAAIFDDPKMASIVKRASGNIQRKSQRGRLQFYAFTGTMAAAVAGDRLMILRDTMESAYSCRYCKGAGHTKEVCPTCKGNRVGIDAPEVGCRSCQVLGYERSLNIDYKIQSDDKALWYASGFVLCEHCRGVGTPAGLIIPDAAKTAPISGVVVSVGPQCVDYQWGDRVLFSRYSGHQLDTPGGETYFTMHEAEVLQLLKEI